MSDWRAYERQILDKFRKTFPGTKITPDAKKIGVFSKRSRQIDILIEGTLIGKPIFGVVECKLFNRKVNIKHIESFLSFMEDVGANVGIVITDVGYSASAKTRVSHLPGTIHLDVIKFKKLSDYEFRWDWCPNCTMSGDHSASHMIWNRNLKLKFRGKNYYLQTGQCERCGDDMFKCNDCGMVLEFYDEKNAECECGIKFQKEEVYIRHGMTEPELEIVGIEKLSDFAR